MILYDKTIMYLSDQNNGLQYYRYQAIKYLKPDKKTIQKGRHDICPIGEDYENSPRQANR